MKTSIAILFICVFPLLLLATIQNNQPASLPHLQQILSPDGEFLSPSQTGAMNLPAEAFNSDRSWHLLEMLNQNDYDYDNVFDIASKEVTYYNSEHPDRLDSLSYNLYHADTQTFGTTSSKRFFYDANGNIIRMEWHYTQDPPNLYKKTIYEYDDQNRLIHQFQYNKALESDPQVLNIRFYWILDEDSVIERYFVYFDLQNQPTSYTHTVFLHDAQKRNVGFLAYSSTDSLNWAVANDCVTTYHPNDTSTGLNMINYYKYGYIVDSYVSAGGYTPYSMMAGFTVRTWTNNDWVNTNRAEYAYNNDNTLQSYTNSYVNPDWYVYNRYVYDYNANLVPTQISYQLMDNVNNVWLGYQKIHNLTWGEFVGNNDETTPGIALGLSVYPNPFQNDITINLRSKDNSTFDAGIYNIKGQLVKQFTNQRSQSLTWDGKDQAHKSVSNGIYLIKVNQNGKSITKKIMHIH
jgi:hypothetical protein